MVDKISYTFNPFDLTNEDPPSRNLREAKKQICELVLEKVLEDVGAGRSPVAGGSWKKSLSKEYKKYKSQFSSTLYANMELHGDMLDALECVVTRGGELELRVRGAQADKADGHNNHTGRSSLPPREFIPKEGQTFKRPIINAMREIIREFKDDNGDT